MNISRYFRLALADKPGDAGPHETQHGRATSQNGDVILVKNKGRPITGTTLTNDLLIYLLSLNG
jgi:hypothetical protein